MADRRMAYETYRKRAEIPRGLDYLADRLVRAVIRVQPKNVREFAAEFFEELLRQRDQTPKTRSPSPESEFVAPTFETVTVTTQQPRKSDDAVATGCDDFDKYALDEDDADGRSLHLVEATAVRTLAASSGSVAILGTTAKCKSLCGSPQQSSADGQRTWPPPVVASKSHPELQRTGGRADAAASFDIPVDTVYSKLEPEPSDPTRYVKATAVRCLAAETGSIAILAASTAVQRRAAAGSPDDVDRMPVGVRETLDREPADDGPRAPPPEDREPAAADQRTPPPDDREPPAADPRTPPPVVHATADDRVPANSFRPIEGAMLGCSSPVETSSCRRPFLRQFNETCDKYYSTSADTWTPTVAVFAKCLPAKSKSLPSKDTVSADEPGDEGRGQSHGVVRGSSLPLGRAGNAAGNADGGPEADDADADGGPEADDADADGAPAGRTMDDAEYRLTMIDSVREAVNRICEQAVEKTAALVKSGRGRPNARTPSGVRDAADDSEAADYASSEFSLPPPPDPASVGQEFSWPPPPPLSETEEERTIAPGFSFDLPDPPTEMDQMDSETDKLDISDEEMRATGLPSDDDDDDDRMDIEPDGGDMKSTTAEEPGAGGPPTTTTAANDGADDRAATTIQAVYRGFRARKYVETVTAAAVKIQAGFRGYRVRQSLKNAAPPSSTATATTTADNSQCWSDDDQKSVVSVAYAPLNECDRGEAFACDGDGAGGPPERATADDGVRALTDAAVKIQAAVRGFAARKRLDEERNADGE